MQPNKFLSEMRFFDYGGTMTGIYPAENKSSVQHKKLVRMLTVAAYLLCVSLAAILLSLYYLFLWNPDMNKDLPDIQSGFTKELCSSTQQQIQSQQHAQYMQRLEHQQLEQQHRQQVQQQDEQRQPVIISIVNSDSIVTKVPLTGVHSTSISSRHKRQVKQLEADIENDAELCKGRSPSEYFRLTADEDCRDVVRCSVQGLLALRCPSGLAFDIDKQTCDWKSNVKNCKQLEKPRLVAPLLATDEPLCDPGKLACGNGDCIEKELFCNGVEDCSDSSDENVCTVDKDPNRAPPCDQSQCVLPDCFCSVDGTQIPGKLEPNTVPQMITITFDDAINNNNIDLYDKIFREGRNNPNGCMIKGTFFVSHKYSNYSAIQEMHRKGHEMAAHSITHKHDEKYWSEASVETWAKEMAGVRLIMERFSNITDNSIVGVRAPYLRVGGNSQFKMMEDQSFLYDSTIAAPLSNPPLWPYTLYFRMPHKCHGNGQNCPSRSHAVWEMVMNELDRRDDPSFDEELAGCAMVDACSNIISGEQFYNFLNHNFERHYKTNRAPLGLYFHAGWLKLNPDYLDSFIQWIDETLAKNDVFFVTLTQVLQWMQDPTPIAGVRDFTNWKEKCDVKGQPLCSLPNACPLTTRELPGETIRLHTCIECPQNYPWLEDPTGDYYAFKK